MTDPVVTDPAVSPEAVAWIVWQTLSTQHGVDRRVTLDSVAHWVEYQASQSPEVPLLPESIQSDAALWASYTAVPVLEIYVAAAIMELEKSAISKRAAKRLASLGWRKMDIVDREAFKKWIGAENG